MLTYAILATVLASPQDAPPPTGRALIEKAFARYSAAKSLEGTVTLTQSARGVSVRTTTTLAYERPSKILLVQKQGGSDPKSSLLVSNGEKFIYSRPETLLTQTDFMGELVKPDERRPALTLSDMYAIVASGLPDRSPLLDVLVAREDDLKFVAKQFREFKYEGKAQFGNRSLHVIKGRWQENELVQGGGAGNFELYISDEGDLVRYVLKQLYAVPGGVQNGRPVPSGDPIEVVSTWDASVAVNGPIKPDTFALRAR